MKIISPPKTLAYQHQNSATNIPVTYIPLTNLKDIMTVVPSNDLQRAIALHSVIKTSPLKKPESENLEFSKASRNTRSKSKCSVMTQTEAIFLPTMPVSSAVNNPPFTTPVSFPNSNCTILPPLTTIPMAVQNVYSPNKLNNFNIQPLIPLSAPPIVSPLKANLKKRSNIQTTRLLSKYRCETCLKSFRRASDLYKHNRTHTGEKPYTCTYCGRSFADSSSLSAHKRTHTGERPYQCEYCRRSFSVSSSLIKHRRLHTGEKPYECNACHRRFTDSSSLTSHRKAKSCIKKPDSC